jgi:hypothetical protein
LENDIDERPIVLLVEVIEERHDIVGKVDITNPTLYARTGVPQIVSADGIFV